MTYTFVNISATKFSLNGNTFFKTFLPFYIDDTHLRIYNIYDSKLPLVQLADVSDISVDGVSYSTTSEVINVIHEVLFSVESSGTTISDQQIELNRLAIIELQNSKSDTDHTHDSRYYTQTQVDNLIAQISTTGGIKSGYVDGNKIKFFDSSGNLVLSVAADPFLAQGVTVVFNDGILSLKDASGTVLSTTPVKARELFYDTYRYLSGVASDLSDLVLTTAFALCKTNSDTYYFVSDINNEEQLEENRLYLNDKEAHFDLGIPGITTTSFNAWLIATDDSGYIDKENYEFNFWLKNKGSGETNLSYAEGSTGLTINSSTGGGVEIPYASQAGSGFMSQEHLLNIDSLNQSNSLLWNRISGSKLINGGVVWVSGLTYEVSTLSYYYNGLLKSSIGGQITLSASDTTTNRIDVVLVDGYGNIIVVEGAPSANPTKPEYDETQYVEVSFILVEANTTEPSSVATYVLYQENLQESGGEWDVDSYISNDVNTDDITDPYQGTYNIKVGVNTNSGYFTLNNSTGVALSDFDTFAFYIKFASYDSANVFVCSFRFADELGNSSPYITDYNGDFSIDTSNTTDYQLVTIPKSLITGLSGTSIVSFKMLVSKNMEAYIDYIRFIGDSGSTTTTTQVSTFIGLTDTPNDYTGNAGKALVVTDNETGVGFVDFPDNSSGVSIQDENGIEQFSGSEIKFEGFGFDVATGKIINVAYTANTYFLSENGNDTTGQIGSVDNPYYSLNAIFANYDLTTDHPAANSFKIVILDGSTYPLTDQIPNITFEIYSSFPCVVDLSNNTNANIVYSSNTAEKHYLYWNMPLGSLKNVRTGTSGGAIICEDNYNLINLNSIKVDSTSSVFMSGTSYIQNLNVLNTTSSINGIQNNLSLKTITIPEGVSSGILSGAKIIEVGNLVHNQSSSVYFFESNQLWRIGDITGSKPIKFSYTNGRNTRLEFMNSKIKNTGGIQFVNNQIGDITFSGTIKTLINFSGIFQGRSDRISYLRFINLTIENIDSINLKMSTSGTQNTYTFFEMKNSYINISSGTDLIEAHTYCTINIENSMVRGNGNGTALITAVASTTPSINIGGLATDYDAIVSQSTVTITHNALNFSNGIKVEGDDGNNYRIHVDGSGNLTATLI
ncbi:hypothetical protein NBRC110019_20980 [Neptunitalea chrysea]|uniref:Uncharacterized protein n=1 Tax=Neptunitalea chrysea TaxID=1647581 RepID=A0A9W6B5K8_9FLAO|nr:hypothetical protein [Neptunitalea chrysea]GLB53058.1 hypothetical protein NBRC110019_20980 [Neptunitalea chrysea]